MSDQDRNLNAELAKKVALLEKALIRERNTKKRLEQKLDQKKESIFNENKEMLSAVERAESQRLQFQFLSRLTEELLSNKKTKEIVDNFIFTLSEFMSDCPVIQLSQQVNLDSTMTTLAGKEWQTQPWQPIYDTLFEKMLRQDEYVWHRIEHANELSNNPLAPLLKNSTLLYLINHESNLQKRVIILDIDHFCYSADFKQTLNIAGKQFSLAIKRRVAERELHCNYDVLKNILADLEHTQQQLIHSEKMASIGQLAAGIAHEINNPIGFISSNLDVLSDYANIFESYVANLPEEIIAQQSSNRDLSFAREDINELITSCVGGVKRVAEIVNSLKNFSRKEEDEFTQVSVNEVIKSALKIVWNHLKYDHEVITHYCNDSVQIAGHFGQLQQVFVNLFVNAAQAMTSNGTLTISSEVTKQFIEIKVADTGIGISQGNISKIFDPFYTSKGENEGTGLGLSVSYAILEKHHALVEVDSQENIGTTFIINFPISTNT